MTAEQVVVYVAWDLETTGLSRGSSGKSPPDEILSIGWAATTGTIACELFARPVKAVCHPRALAVHGITDAVLRRNGARDLGHALRVFTQSIAAFPRVVLVAHNGLHFDSLFLRGGLEAWRIELPPCVEGFIDTYVDQKTSLDKLAARLGVATTARAQFHGALVDAMVLAEVFEKLYPDAASKPADGHPAYETVARWRTRTAGVVPPPTHVEKIVAEMLGGVIERVTTAQMLAVKKRALGA